MADKKITKKPIKKTVKKTVAKKVPSSKLDKLTFDDVLKACKKKNKERSRKDFSTDC